MVVVVTEAEVAVDDVGNAGAHAEQFNSTWT